MKGTALKAIMAAMILASGVMSNSCFVQQPISIGAILSISGPDSHNTQEIANGLLLAIDEINAKGGINGRLLEIIIEDSKADPPEGIEAFHRIETNHYPDVYVSNLSSVSLALAPLAEEHAVVLVALQTSAPDVTEHNEWVYRYWPTAEDDASTISLILEDLKLEEVGVIYLDDVFGQTLFKAVKKEFTANGGMVKAISYKPEEMNYEKQIGELIDMDAIYFIGFGNHTREAIIQLREEDFKGHIIAGNAVLSPSMRNMPEAEGVYAPAPAIYDSEFLFASDVAERYEVRYGKPFSVFAASSFFLSNFIFSPPYFLSQLFLFSLSSLLMSLFHLSFLLAFSLLSSQPFSFPSLSLLFLFWTLLSSFSLSQLFLKTF